MKSSLLVPAITLGLLTTVSCVGRRPRQQPKLDPRPWLPMPSRGVGDGARDADPAPAMTPETRDSADASTRPTSTGAENRRIDLVEVLDIASRNGIEFLIASERASIAQSEEAIARAGWTPELSVGTQFFRHEGRTQATQGAILNVDKQNAFLGTGLELSIDPGETMYDVGVAEERTDAALHDVRAAQDETMRQAANHYFDLVEGYIRIRIAESAIEQAEELVRYEETRTDSGSGLEADLLRARARSAGAQREVLSARNAASISSSHLVEILQLDTTTELVPADIEISTIELVPLEDLVGLIDRAQANRPEIAAAGANVRAGELEEQRSERAWMIPEVLLRVTYGGFGDDYGDLADQETYAVGLQWDFGLALAGERDRARAELRAVQLEDSRLRRRVGAEVVRAFRTAETAREQIRSARFEVEAARGAYELARVRRDQGAVLLIELLDAEHDHLRAENELAEALAAYNRAQYDLLRAIGGPGS